MRERTMTSAFLPEVASPCINVCNLDPHTGWCTGCRRTLDEIAAWGTLDDAQKREVWRQLPQRRLDPDAERDAPP